MQGAINLAAGIRGGWLRKSRRRSSCQRHFQVEFPSLSYEEITPGVLSKKRGALQAPLY